MPRTSATICARTVSDPVPRSVAPINRLKEPSSFILRLAAPMSRYGIAVPCIIMAMPMPRRRWGLLGTRCQASTLNLSSQPITARPCRTHSSRPTVWIISGRGSRPSLQAVLKGCSSPGRSAFFNRNSIGSSASERAIFSMCRSTAQYPCGTP